MSDNKVQGKNVIVTMLYSGVYYPIFCCKSMSFDQVQETIEVTSVNSGNDREYEPGMSTATMTVSGITTLNNVGSRISVLYLIQLAVRREIQSLKVTLTDNDGNSKDVTFDAIITSNNFTKELGGAYSQSSTGFQITGGITISDPVGPPSVQVVQDPLYIDGVPGATSVSDPLLEAAGVVILEVQREGLGHDPTNGTPGNREFKFTGGAGNGTIAFDPTNPFNPGPEVVYVLYKK